VDGVYQSVLPKESRLLLQAGPVIQRLYFASILGFVLLGATPATAILSTPSATTVRLTIASMGLWRRHRWPKRTASRSLSLHCDGWRAQRNSMLPALVVINR